VTDRSHLRLVVLSVLVISLVATLLGRLWYLQVLAAPTYRAAAADNQVRDIVTQPARGGVFDDEGRPLIDNKTALVVSVSRTSLNSQPDGGRAVLHRLSRLLHTPYHLLNHETQMCGLASNGKTIGPPCWGGSPYEPIPVSQLSPTVKAIKQALQIEELKQRYPGVTAELTAVRNYPRPAGAKASAILGYTEPISASALAKLSPQQQVIQRSTDVGATGLEYSYQKYLRGTPGVREVTVDHLGTVTGTVKTTPPKAGDNIITNIDAKAQADLEKQLQNAIHTARGRGYSAQFAAGVVLNARTGGVVAMASNPTYSPNHAPPTLTVKQYKALLHAPGSPLFDKAFQAAEPPGSTFKMISSAGLLNDGMIVPGGLYDCPTTFQNRHSFEGAPGLGPITLQTAIEVSCDTFFFRLGYYDWVRDNHLVLAHQAAREGVQHMARDLGLGENPGIDLPNATYGHIPDRKNTRLEWQQTKKNYCEGARQRPQGSYLQILDHDYCVSGYTFYPGDQENEDVGQGTVTVSPLQLAVAYAALANGGTVFEPRVAKAIVSPTGKLIRRIKAPVRGHIPLSSSELDYLRQCFYAVTTGAQGTAKGAFAGFPMGRVLVGGKTGTAELPHSPHQNNAWFVSFGGPAGEKPQYVTVIEVYKSNQGAISAAPFVRNMWDDLYGFAGAKAVFTNGVPPANLPHVGVPAGTTRTHHASGKSAHGAARRTTPNGPSSPPALTATGSLTIRLERRAFGSP
jgi:penicillin-binding protein 2